MTQSAQSTTKSVDPGRLRLDAGGGEQGTLIGMRCLDCGVCVFGQAVFCQACSSARLEAVDLSRTGTLYSYTIVRVPPDGWPGPVPYVLGEVEVPEGPHILAEVIDVAHGDLKIGMDVRLALQEVRSGGETGPALMVYKWAPATGAEAESEEA